MELRVGHSSLLVTISVARRQILFRAFDVARAGGRTHSVAFPPLGIALPDFLSVSFNLTTAFMTLEDSLLD